jgi:predicted secreted protein
LTLAAPTSNGAGAPAARAASAMIRAMAVDTDGRIAHAPRNASGAERGPALRP